MKTAKPTENELEIAIVAAEQGLQGGQDPHHVASALIYLLTRNLWICLAVHWLLELTFWHLGRLPESAGRLPSAQAADGEA